MHAKVVRPYSHSYSDDEKLYKTQAERESESARDPLKRLREYLVSGRLATGEELDAIGASGDAEIAAAPDAGGSLGRLNACPSRPAWKALPRHPGSGHT